MRHALRLGLYGLVVISAPLARVDAQTRPNYGSDPVRTLDVTPPGVNPATDPGRCFKIHYTTKGGNAPAATDTAPANGIPDYVDQLAAVLIEVYRREIIELGWPPPPSDASSRVPNGGDGRYDVYVVPEPGIGAVHPDSATVPGGNSWRSFMTFDVNVKARYDGLNNGPGDISTLSQRQVISDVVAHEYFHSIQFGFSGSLGLGLGTVMEATANWMNDEAFTDLNVNVRCENLGDFTLFRDPSRSYERITYGGWFWYRYLSERYGRAIIRDIWQRLSAVDPNSTGPDSAPEVTQAALATRGGSLFSAWVDFAGKLDAKSWFEEGGTWPEVRALGLAGSFATYPTNQANRAVSHLARQYVRFDPPSVAGSPTIQVSFSGPALGGGAAVVLETADHRRIDREVPLDVGHHGVLSISGFGATRGPDHLKVTSVVLASSNGERQTDNADFGFRVDLLSGPNPSITPYGQDWGYRPPLWQSPDIWVDNDGGGASGKAGAPVKGRVNKLFARVYNLGDRPATGTKVCFSYAPCNVGVPDEFFAEIGAVQVDLAPAGDTKGGDVKEVSIDWDLKDLKFNHGGRWDVPETCAHETLANFDHFCVRVSVELAADVDPSNNHARSNFVNVSGAPVQFSLLVGNTLPTRERARLRAEVRGFPAGWAVSAMGLDNELTPNSVRLAQVKVERGGAAAAAPGAAVADISLLIRDAAVGGFTIHVAPAATGRVAAARTLSAVRAARASFESGRDPGSAAAHQPLLLIEPRKGLDYSRLAGLVTLHDQYVETDGGEPRLYLLAVTRGSSLVGLDELPLDYRVLSADARSLDYLWLAPSAESRAAALAESEPRVMLLRQSGPTLVGVTPGKVDRLIGAIHGPPVVRVDLDRALRPGWVDAEALASHSVVPQARAGRGRAAEVDALIGRVDPTACRALLQKLTGLTPIDTPNGPVTVASRYATSPELSALFEWLGAELRGLGYDARIETFHSRVHDRELPQVVATKLGSDLAQELVLVTAHLDAVRECPGADDNASGVTAMVEAARLLSKLRFRRTVQLVAFNDEEQGLVGSDDFARRLAEVQSSPGGPRVLGVLNLDMVAYDANKDSRIQLQTNGIRASNLLADHLAQAATQYRLDLVPVKVTDAEQSSDYASFWRVGIPAINIGDEYFLCDRDTINPPERGVNPPRGDFNPCYHRPCDKLDTPGFRLGLVAEVAKMLVAGVANLAEVQP
jgi:hypothetical protein